MKTTYNASPQGEGVQSKGWVSHLSFLVMVLLGTVVLYGLMRALGFVALYNSAFDFIASTFGLDARTTRPLAIIATFALMAGLPTIALFVFFGVRSKRAYVVGGVLVMLLLMLAFFSPKNVFFDRASGESRQCYAKLNGAFKFSSTCDYDPALGVHYKPITREIAHEIDMWKKGQAGVPLVGYRGKFFDTLTGSPLVWCSIRPGDKITLWSSPGFDSVTGEALVPVTKAVIDRYHLLEQVEEIIPKQAEGGLVYEFAQPASQNSVISSPSVMQPRQRNLEDTYIVDEVGPTEETEPPKIIQVTVCHPYWNRLNVGTLNGRKTKWWGPTASRRNWSRNLPAVAAECETFHVPAGSVISNKSSRAGRIISTQKMNTPGNYTMG